MYGSLAGDTGLFGVKYKALLRGYRAHMRDMSLFGGKYRVLPGKDHTPPFPPPQLIYFSVGLFCGRIGALLREDWGSFAGGLGLFHSRKKSSALILSRDTGLFHLPQRQTTTAF